MLLKPLSQVAPRMTDPFIFPALLSGMWALVPWPGIKPAAPALKAWSLNHWTTREVPYWYRLLPDHDLNFRGSFFPHSRRKALLLHQSKPLHVAAPLMCPGALTISAHAGLRSQLHTWDQGDFLLGGRRGGVSRNSNSPSRDHPWKASGLTCHFHREPRGTFCWITFPKLSLLLSYLSYPHLGLFPFGLWQ